MLSIKRTCTNRIITRALRFEGRALVATLQLDADDCEVCEDIVQLQQHLKQKPNIVIVHNQHPDAITWLDTINTPLDQLFIEIRQDTKGVLGLHAWYRNNGQIETLELLDER